MAGVFPDVKGFIPPSLNKREKWLELLNDVQCASVGCGVNVYGCIIANLCHQNNFELPEPVTFNNRELAEYTPQPEADLYINGAEIFRPAIHKNVGSDGDCLFRAASLAITGTEDNHYLLRLLTVSLAMKKQNWTRVQRLLPRDGHRATDTFPACMWGYDEDNKCCVGHRSRTYR